MKIPGENAQGIFSSMESDMQTVTTNILSSQGFSRPKLEILTVALFLSVN